MLVFVRVRPVLPNEVDNQYLLEHDKREAVQVSKVFEAFYSILSSLVK